METSAGKLNLRPLRAITAEEAPDAPELPVFGATHLRTGLSRLPVLLSSGRLMAIIAPLFAAAFFWVTVPAFAASNDPIVVVPPSSSSAGTATSHTDGSQGSGVAPQVAVQASAAAAAPAQQAAPAAAPQAAAPAAAPQAAAPAAAPAAVPTAARRAPKTGANDGFLRILLVGICLASSGLALLTAPKRNPHAVLWA